MKLAFALLTSKTLHFTSANTVMMYLKQNDTLLEASIGEDIYTYDGTLFPDTPVAATGRKAIHTAQPDLMAYTGMPGEPVEIVVPEGQTTADVLQTLTLWLDSNAILSQGELQTYFSLRCTIDGVERPISLLMRNVRWEGHGLFRIQLEGII